MMKKAFFFLFLLLCVFGTFRGEWAKTLHVGLFDYPGELIPTADGRFIFPVCPYNPSSDNISWLIKYDANHEIEWQRSYTAGYNVELSGTAGALSFWIPTGTLLPI